MKTNLTTLLSAATLLASVGLASCGSQSGRTSSPSDLPVIDFANPSDKVTLDLNEIADVEYIPLETNDSCMISLATDINVSDSLIVLLDYMQRSIMIFDRSGKHVVTYNRRGEGPGEFTRAKGMAVDFDLGEIYVDTYKGVNRYGFDGSFKGKLDLGDKREYTYLYSYDKDRLIAYDETDLTMQPLTDNDQPLRYLLIDKNTGEISRLPIAAEHPVGTKASFKLSDDGTNYKSVTYSIGGIGPIVKTGDSFTIADFVNDTVFVLGQDGELTPTAIFSGLDRKGSFAPDIVSIGLDTDPYLFVDKLRVLNVTADDLVLDEETGGDYVYDKRSGKLSRYYIEKPYDTSDEDGLSFGNIGNSAPRNMWVMSIPADRIQDLNDEGKVAEPLKSIVESLEPEANPVVMIVKFKE